MVMASPFTEIFVATNNKEVFGAGQRLSCVPLHINRFVMFNRYIICVLSILPLYSMAQFEDWQPLVYTNIEHIELAPNDVIWLANGSTILRFENGVFTEFDADNAPTGGVSKAIASEADGDIWIGCSTGLIFFDGNTFTTINTSHVQDILVVGTDVYVLYLTGGLRKFDGSTWTNYPIPGLPAGAWSYSLARSNDGKLWVAHQGNGLSVFDGTSWSTHNTSTGLPSNNLNDVAVAPDQSIWVATNNAGIAKLENGIWTSYNISNSGLQANQTLSIEVDATGTVWTGHWTGPGLVRFDGWTWIAYSTQNSNVPFLVHHLVSDIRGDLWVGGSSLARLTVGACESQIQGNAYKDMNSNGVLDNGEPSFQGILQLDGQPSGYMQSSSYTLCSPLGEHTVAVTNPPAYHTIVPASHTYTTSELEPLVSGLDCALQPIPGMLDGAVHLYGDLPWIGNYTSTWLHYENIGTEPIDAVLEFHLDPLLEFVSADEPPSSVSGNTVTWDLGTLQPYHEGSIQMTIYTPPTVPWNTPVTNWALVTITGSDVDGSNNTDEWKPEVIAAYDPNDKQVTTAVLTPDEVAGGTKLGYTIRFQNTGNAPAVNVVIRDTIDPGLDLGTFEMIGSSHGYQLSLNGNELVWLFPNIMLPDSTTDFDASIGTFHYRIAMREDLVLDDQVENEAQIYFDYADPIITNTVVTTVALPQAIDGVDALQHLLMHPVPNEGPFNIRWLGDQVSDAWIVITDGVGREVQRIGPVQLQSAQDVKLDLSDRSNGMYLIAITGTGVSARGRVLVKH